MSRTIKPSPIINRSLAIEPSQSSVTAAATWVGTEWVVEAHHCSANSLRSLALFDQICGDIVADLELNVVGEPLRHKFPGPGGVTLLYLLSESHLACHTYPEYQLATFNLYCCRQREAWPWQDQLCLRLGAGRVSVRQVRRGTEAGRNEDA